MPTADTPMTWAEVTMKPTLVSTAKRSHHVPRLLGRAAAWVFTGCLVANVALAQPAPEGEDTLTASLSIRLDNAQQFQREMHGRVAAGRHELRGLASQDPMAGDLPPDFRFTPGALAIGQGAWITGSARFSNLDGSGTSNDIDAGAYGVQAGWDGRLGHSTHSPWSRVRVGGAFAYFHSNYEGGQSPSGGEATSYMLGLYASWALPRFYVSVDGQYGYETIWTHRTLAGGIITRGNGLGSSWGASIEIGGMLGEPEEVHVVPVAGFSYNGVLQSSFSEDGGPAAAYEIAEADVTSLETRLGLRFSKLIALDPALFGGGLPGEFGIEPEVRAFWHQEWGDRDRPVILGDVGGGGPVTFTGAATSRASFRIGAGYTMRLAEIALVRAGYDARISGDRIDHVVEASLILSF